MVDDTLARTDVQIGNYSLAQVVNQQLWKNPGALDSVAIVTFPMTALDNLPPMYRPVLAAVTVDSRDGSREIYPVGGSKFGLSKSPILRMLKAAGASVTTTKMSSRHDLDYIEWSATCEGYTPDGTPHRITCSKVWEWNKVQEQCTESEAKAQRKFADEICETKAILRAARAFLTIHTSYTKEELNRPFLIAKAVPDLDPNDPDVKKAMIDKAFHLTDAIYPTPSLPAAISEDDDDPQEEPAQTAEFRQEDDEDAFAQPTASGAPKCVNGHEITPVTKQGVSYTVNQIVDLTQERAGSVMCYDCYAAWKKAGGTK